MNPNVLFLLLLGSLLAKKASHVFATTLCYHSRSSIHFPLKWIFLLQRSAIARECE